MVLELMIMIITIIVLPIIIIITIITTTTLIIIITIMITIRIIVDMLFCNSKNYYFDTTNSNVMHVSTRSPPTFHLCPTRVDTKPGPQP
jgi:hypothetical protein